MDQLILGPMVGGLADTSAFLWGRAQAPGSQATTSPDILLAWLGQQADLSDAWLAGQSYPLSANNGYAGVVPVQGLLPETRYYYTLTLNAQTPSPAAGPYPAFTTFPAAGTARSFAFAFGSCFRPEDENGGQIFDQLEAYRQRHLADPQRALRFLLLIGDQIYADDRQYNSLGKVAVSLEEYRQVYAYTWGRPAFRDALKNIPVYMTLDDHEVDDDWTWRDFERQRAQIPIWDRVKRWLQGAQPEEYQLSKARVQNALQAYWEHQGMHARSYINTPRLSPEGHYTLATGDQGSLAYTFEYGAAAFFVMDTRSMRVKQNQRERSMLGEGQWQALESWLLSVRETYPVKFIISSCALLFRMWADLPRDRWTGFPRERHRLLQFLAQHEIEGVYLLTGDLHSAHAISAELKTPTGKLLPLWEFCSTPFEQETNWLAKATYLPLGDRLLQNQQLHFCLAEHNFGVVEVDFDGSQTQVRFRLQRPDTKPELVVEA